MKDCSSATIQNWLILVSVYCLTLLVNTHPISLDRSTTLMNQMSLLASIYYSMENSHHFTMQRIPYSSKKEEYAVLLAQKHV